MNVYRILVSLILAGIVCASVRAQGNSCEEQLNAATAEFEAGRFYGIASMLKPCIDKGFTNEQRKRAYLLLTQTYLLLEDPIGADHSFLEVLRADPEFETDTARDQIDLVYLSKRFTAAPQFSVFGRLGANISQVRVIQTINASGETGVANAYKQRAGFQTGIGADWHVTDRFMATAEIDYVSTAYQKSQVSYQNDLLEISDRQHWLSVPVGVKYAVLTRGKYRPYIVGGYAVNLLFNDKAQINLYKRDEGEGTLEESSPTIDMNPFRRKINTSFFLGAGVKYKIGLNYVFAEMRYNFGLTNVVKPTSTYGGDTPATRFGHVDDYFRLDNLSVSIGYVMPRYKPRQVKRAKTKTVLKGIKKQAR